MKTILVIILSFLVGSSFAEGEWSTDRLASFLRGSCRFIESDCDETDASDDIHFFVMYFRKVAGRQTNW